MQSYPDNHFSCVCTDPPYGLKFMGKHWDHGIPGVEFWKEMLRICKPGSWLLAFGGTRTYHRLTCAIEDAGWEIRDCIMWLYGSGFPKGKGCLKPAWEPIILARKKAPKPELNIDECRIGSFSDMNPKDFDDSKRTSKKFKSTYRIYEGRSSSGEIPNGRWPANLILDEEAGEMLDEQSGNLKGNCGIKGVFKGQRHGGQFAGGGVSKDRQYNFEGYHDTGGASRFFYCAKASSSEREKGLEAMQQKSLGCYGEFEGDGRGRQTEHSPRSNFHPTVKPIKLMEYLIKLIAPKEGPILDPFAGSGSTLVAAKNLGVECIGIEKEKEYVDICKARLGDIYE